MSGRYSPSALRSTSTTRRTSFAESAGCTGSESTSPAADGLLDGWASTCSALLFHPSTWIFLDGGTLNLGAVRDATLVGTDDFLIFSETMENVTKRGVESLALTMTLCADGTTSAPISINDVCPQGS
jgi:hypothetical protein